MWLRLVTSALIASIVVFLLVVGYLIYVGGIVTPRTQEFSLLSLQYNPKLEEEGVINMIGIDMLADGDVTTNSVIKGDDAILMVLPTAQDPPVAPLNLLSFNDLYSLAIYDTNLDGVIDGHDPIYNSLILVTFHPRKQVMRYISLSKAGIHAIHLHRDYLLSEKHDKTDRLAKQASTAILADSSKRSVKVIPLHVKHFKNVVVTPVIPVAP